ncbi:MAG: nickel/cobalt transporter [Pseudomonadota bacterium]
MKISHLTISLFILLAFAAVQLFIGSGQLRAQHPTVQEQNAQNKSAFSRAQSNEPSQDIGILGSYYQWIQNTQRDFHLKLAQAIRNLKDTNVSFTAGWFLISLSFIYGVVHAAGPGHGKAVISSYMLANNAIIRRGIILSFLAAGVQAITAIVLVGITVGLFKATGYEIKQSINTLITLSYGLVILIGIWLCVSVLRSYFSSHAHDHGEGCSGHDHDHSTCGHAHMPDAQEIEQNTSIYNMASLIFAVGLRPCTGAVLVLIFAITHGLYWAGVVSAFAMAIGTAITVSTLAVLAGSSRKAILFFSGNSHTLTTRISFGLSLTGAVLITLLGIVLFFSSLGPAPPF